MDAASYAPMGTVGGSSKKGGDRSRKGLQSDEITCNIMKRLDMGGVGMLKKLRTFIGSVFERDRYLKKHMSNTSFQNKLIIQVIISAAFFLLSIANIIAKSNTMLIFTLSGCVINVVFAILAKKCNNRNLCALSSVATCSVLFGFFVVSGGNDGFACLWVVLLPLLSMVAMDFTVGLCAGAFFQVFLILVFWTPLRDRLQYHYNDQFCLRFPLFYCVTFMLGLAIAVSLRKSEYDGYRHLQELEDLTAKANALAGIDPLTKLANRRSAYEEFDSRYTTEGEPHCVVMGDIDFFKRVNDTYGHEFGDEVLIAFAGYITDLLPPDYLKARWGGEEFLLAANAPAAEVYAQVEGLRKAIAEHEFMFNGVPVHITMTFGIAGYANKDELAAAINTADDMLYNGKKSKKNCTVIAV